MASVPNVPSVPGAPLPTLPAFLEDAEDWPDDDGQGVDLDKLLESDWDGLDGWDIRRLL